MARSFEHTHNILKDQPDSAHVDTHGSSFGGEEHEAAVTAAKWPAGTFVQEIKHTHANVRQTVHPESFQDEWSHEPPEDEDAAPTKAAVATK